VRAGAAVRTKVVHRIPAQGPKTHGLGAFSGHLRGFQGGTAFAKQFHVQTHLEPHKMKKTLLALTLAALTSGAATTALAADPKAPEPEFTISGNVALVSDYRFRGVTQTFEKPAIQGGFDFTHQSGAYLGTWASNVGEWANFGGNMEIDFYGGYRGTLPTVEVDYDIGLIAYQYPGNTANVSNNTREWYVGFSKGPVAYKFYRTTGNWFGISNSSGSTYHDLTASFEFNEQVSVGLHAGRQNVAGSAEAINPDFTDYSVGISVALPDDYALGVKFTTVDFKDSRASTSGWFNTATSYKPNNMDLAKDAIVLSLSKTF
jgi:uncharacterized protein (TIGR02001 family)